MEKKLFFSNQTAIIVASSFMLRTATVSAITAPLCQYGTHSWIKAYMCFGDKMQMLLIATEFMRSVMFVPFDKQNCIFKYLDLMVNVSV